MRKIYLLFLFAVSFCFSQSKAIDSLNLVIKTTKSDSIKVDTYNKLTWQYIFNDKNKALEILIKTEKLALQKNQKYGYNTYLINKGIFYAVNGSGDSAKIYFQKAVDYSVKNKFPIQEQYGYNNLGMYYWNKGKYQEALTNFFKALKLSEENYKKDKSTKVDAPYNNIGLIYQEMELYEKAIAYHKKALGIRIIKKNAQGEASSYNNLGICYKSLNRIKEAKLSFQNGIKRAVVSNDKMIYYLNTQGLAQIFSKENNHQKALQLYLESYNRPKEIPFDPKSKIHVTSGIAEEYMNLNQPKKAIEFGEICVAEMEKNKTNEVYEVAVYKTLAKAYYETGNSKKGSFYNDLFFENAAKKFKETNAKAIQELETKYETEKKEKLLAEAKSDILLKEIKIKNRTTFLISALALAFILALCGFLYFKQQRFKQQQIAQENELKEQLLKIKHQNKLQEQRLAISKDLHDNIGAQLTFIISSIDNLKYFDLAKENLNLKYDTITGFTKNTILELRDTIWAMNKEEIAMDDLKNRILNFIEAAKISLLGIDFGFNPNAEILNSKFKSKKGILLYRFIQEALNNAIKHSDSTKIDVNFNTNVDNLEISILDNGKGFDEKLMKNEDFLASLKKSAKQLKGNLIVVSNNLGTQIKLELNKSIFSN